MEMGLLEHIRELRVRLIHVGVALALGAALAFIYIDDLLRVFLLPFYAHFQGGELIGMAPAEAFMTKLKVSLLAGAILVSPYIFFQLWLFIAPGLLDNEKRYLVPFVAATSICFLSGVGFAYFVAVPMTLEFFAAQYGSIAIRPTIRLSEHLSFVGKLCLVFGMSFEMPVLSWLGARLKIINAKMLIAGVRYAVVVIFILAAILTPPDVVSQIILAVPLLVLYGISIVVAR